MKEMAHLKSEHEAKLQELSSTAESLKQAENRANELDTSLNEARKQISEMVSQQTNALNAKDERITELETLWNTTKDTANQAMTDLNELRQEHQSVVASRDTFGKQYQDTKIKYDSALLDIDEKGKELGNSEREVAKLTRELKERTLDRDRYILTLSKSQETNFTLMENSENLRKNVQSLTTQLAQQKIAHDQVKELNVNLTSQLDHSIKSHKETTDALEASRSHNVLNDNEMNAYINRLVGERDQARQFVSEERSAKQKLLAERIELTKGLGEKENELRKTRNDAERR